MQQHLILVHRLSLIAPRMLTRAAALVVMTTTSVVDIQLAASDLAAGHLAAWGRARARGACTGLRSVPLVGVCCCTIAHLHRGS